MEEVVLKYPFTAGGKKLEKLTLRQPVVKNLWTMGRYGDSEEEKEIGLMASLSGLIPDDMDAMDLSDYKALQDSFRGMLAE